MIKLDPSNILDMSVTLDVFQVETSEAKFEASLNNWLISVTLDVSQFETSEVKFTE